MSLRAVSKGKVIPISRDLKERLSICVVINNILASTESQ